MSRIQSGGGGGNSTPPTIGTFNGTSTPKGLDITANVISLHKADATNPGGLTSADWTTFNNKLTSTLLNTNIFVGNASNVATAVSLSGDATLANTGALTLSTVNSNVGSFGSSTSIPSFTVNAKGLITAASGNVVIAPAGTLTGTTLASNVVSSSLTSVGTITSGTWNGTTIAIANGGTGQTTANTAFGALSPLTTTGDLIYESSPGVASRLAIGSSGNVLSVSGGIPAWTTAATNATNVATTATNSTNATFFPTFVASGTSGNQGIDTATGLTFNPSTNTLTTTTFVGALTGHASLDLALTGGTMSGAINMGSHLITNVTDPVSAQDAATKNYVDTGLAALNPAQSVYAASTANIPGSYLNGVAGVGATFTTTATGVFTIDGTTPPLNARILIKDQTSGLQNGIYNITTLGALAVQTVFTRALDYNTPSDINNSGLIPVINGTVNALSSWQEIATITTIGTDALVFSEFTANPSLYLLKANNLSDVANKTTSFNNLSPMTTGGDVIYGGASGSGTRLANGSANQVLTSAGGTSAPTWSFVSANTLTGTTLASNVVTSSLSAVDTVTTGTWNATTIAINHGGTGQTTAAAARGPSGLNIDERSTFSNANYTVLSTDRYVAQVGTLSAARVVTLPAASNLNAGQQLVITDESGTVTTTNMLTITAAGSDTINGSASKTIRSAYGYILLYSNGSNQWFTGTEGIGRGGTGISTLPSDGQLLIGQSSTSTYVLSTITAGSGITVTNGSGSITVAASGTNATTTKTANYTILSTDNIIFCDTSGGGFTLTLPAPASLAGTIYRIIDKTGNFQTNNLTLARSASEKIEGLAASKILQTNWGWFHVTTDGTDWYVG